jgi:hypothetical protein
MRIDKPTAGANGFHNGNGALFFIEQGREGALNAQPGYHQDKKPHQFKEKKKIVQKPFNHRPGGQVGVDAFPVEGGSLFQPSGNVIHLKRIHDHEQHHTVDAAAGGHQAQGIQVRTVDEYPGAESKQIQGTVGFGRDHVVNCQGGVADLQPVAHLQTDAIQQGLLHDAGAGCQHLLEGAARFQGDLAVKGVTRFTTFSLDSTEAFLSGARTTL